MPGNETLNEPLVLSQMTDTYGELGSVFSPTDGREWEIVAVAVCWQAVPAVADNFAGADFVAVDVMFGWNTVNANCDLCLLRVQVRHVSVGASAHWSRSASQWLSQQTECHFCFKEGKCVEFVVICR